MNNDLISREALKKGFEKVYPLSVNEMGGAVNKRIYDIIDNAPTVETEITNDDLQAAMTESYRLGYELAETKFKRPQGEWKYSDDTYETLVCSVCGFDTADYTRHNFCPNCGADMRKGGAE